MPSLDGMRKVGASVELLYTKRLDVKPYGGGFYCWRQKLGQCCIDDDLQSLYLRLRDADTIVLATPAYVPLSDEMQNLVDRILPLMGISLKNRNGHTRTRFHSNVKVRKLVQVSPSGWWDIGNFGTVLRLVKQLAKGFSVEFAGALLRPHSGWLTEDSPKTRKVLEAATQQVANWRQKERFLEIS